MFEIIVDFLGTILDAISWKKITDELSVSDAIGDAQSTIDGPSDDKKNSDDVQQLRKALLTSSDVKEIKRLSDKLK